MKTIIISENQYRKLFEDITFDNGDVHAPDGEITATNNVVSTDGNNEYGKPLSTDEVADDLTTQNYWANSTKGAKGV